MCSLEKVLLKASDFPNPARAREEKSRSWLKRCYVPKD